MDGIEPRVKIFYVFSKMVSGYFLPPNLHQVSNLIGTSIQHLSL